MQARRAMFAIAVLAVLGGAGRAVADPLTGGATPAYTPLVPVSAFARPMGWFDPSRLKVSTTVSVGTGWGGGTDGLQVTSLSYQLANPLRMRVSVGNAFGSSTAARGNGFFLEGLAVEYRPHPSFQINVDYRDIRSPLQYPYYSGFGTPYGLYGP